MENRIKRPKLDPSMDEAESPVRDGSQQNNDNLNQENENNESFSDSLVLTTIHLLTEEDFNENTLKAVVVDNNRLEEMCITKVSHKIRRLLRHFQDSGSAKKIITLANQKCKERPCTQVMILPLNLHCFPNTLKKGLFATRDILEGEFIIAPVPVKLSSPEECGRDEMGVLRPNIILFNGLQNDFSFFQVIDIKSRKRKRNTREFQSRRKIRANEAMNGVNKPVYQPHASYYSDDEDIQKNTAYEKYDMCIDLADSTDELKAIRRNCESNCMIRYVIHNQRMQLFISAQRNILMGEELTLPHDYDSNYSSKVIQCAHPYQPHNVCIHEKERQNTIKKFISMNSK
ncbi:SET domain-containing protein [Caenorhabditis elegans]|uniref:SET domain-containing protein n=1 Tax=Caenorhabditis elegans TaxID=6239 RepID=Q9XXS2_CAEEL|nr:SET domain-containing protein [Caenorhabditis elegans]CAA16308.1 SET domain-containing protein [Caenorhabditis elegans]|eukprot:NP_505681.1 SET (trithorax/polycomb) domain containing [Caenorhabditis elegans]